jgi:formylglycine-generating enzyme required for sulfatase activity
VAQDRDHVLAQLAVERGYVGDEHITEAREAQRVAEQQLGMRQSLSQVLVSKGLLSPDQAQDLENAVAVKTGEARLVAGYEVLEKIGQGGMGAVYKARKLDSGEFVALKILLPSLATPEFVKRFKRESEVVQTLDHENIVSCIEFGQDRKRGLHFCALEYVEGEDLGDRVERLGALEQDDAVSIARQVARGLQHAHESGLVHRDIKPENIMVTSSGEVKVLDLGLARPVSQEVTRLTASGMFVGSAFYASPEQAQAQSELDIRSDIYSLGATLYYMVTAHPPFEGGTVLAVLQAHVYEQVRWPAEVNPRLSEGLCLVIARMMAKEPADRYPEPRGVARALRGLEAGRRPAVDEKTLAASTVALAGVAPRKGRPAPPSQAAPPQGKARRAPTREQERRTGPERPAGTRRRRRVAAEAAPGKKSFVPMIAGGLVAAALVVGTGVVMMGGKKKPPAAGAGEEVGTRRDAAAGVSETLPVEGGTEAHSRRVPTSAAGTRVVSRAEPPPTLTLDLGGGATMELVYIKPGVFIMGGGGDEDSKYHAAGVETPKHEVAITRGFYIGRYEVTRGQFAAFVKATGYRTKAEKQGTAYAKPPDARWRWAPGVNWSDPKFFTQTDDHPVIAVSWDDAKAFCEWAAAKTRRGVRLPTEAEWEYACRAGSTARHFFSDQDGGMDEFAWHGGNSGMQTHPVGQKRANAWGLHDTNGNVREWVADWYDAAYYAKSPRENPTGPDTGDLRILRDGCWGEYVSHCRSAIRVPRSPSAPYTEGGFRAAVSLTPDEATAAARRAAARPPPPKTEPPPTLTLDIGGGVEMEFVYIKPGTFVMGGTEDFGRNHPWWGFEKPKHEVAITRGFYIGKYEVTQAQYERIAGTSPSHAKGANNPVGKVTWHDAAEFCRKLSQETGKQVRLPTEAEWEYACRAGSTGRYCFGDDDGRLGEYAWHLGSPSRQTRPVGQKKPNAWGLHDMHGNVWEWCADWYGNGYYAESPREDPAGPRTGETRVVRGGSLRLDARRCRSAFRHHKQPSDSHEDRGFRVAVSLSPAEAAASRRAAPPPPPRKAKPPPTLTLDIGAGVTMDLVYIRPGTFAMGGDGDPRFHGQGVEKPKHEVEITKGFYIGKYEVTRGQFAAFVKATGYKTEAERVG